MTQTLAVHAPLALTMPVAIAGGLVIVWYWLCLGRTGVPVSRRWIRRISIVFLLVSLPMLVRGMSVLDSRTNPGEYVATWMVAIVMVVLVMVTAVIDAANNLRIHRRMRQEVVEQAVRRLVQEISDRRQKQNTSIAPRGDMEQSL